MYCNQCFKRPMIDCNRIELFLSNTADSYIDDLIIFNGNLVFYINKLFKYAILLLEHMIIFTSRSIKYLDEKLWQYNEFKLWFIKL